MATGGKPIKVLRWFVLSIVSWVVAAGIFLFTVVFEIGEGIAGGELADVSTGLQVNFAQGDEFSFNTSKPGTFTCQVKPENAETKTYSVQRSTRIRARNPGAYDRAWFTGSAEIQCAAPAGDVGFKSPAEFAQDDLWFKLLAGAIGAGGDFLVIGVILMAIRGRG